jgi:hypothetical protein
MAVIATRLSLLQELRLYERMAQSRNNQQSIDLQINLRTSPGFKRL